MLPERSEQVKMEVMSKKIEATFDIGHNRKIVLIAGRFYDATTGAAMKVCVAKKKPIR